MFSSFIDDSDGRNIFLNLCQNILLLVDGGDVVAVEVADIQLPASLRPAAHDQLAHLHHHVHLCNKHDSRV